MPTLVRNKVWAGENLTYPDLNAEIDNIIGHVEAFLVSSPLQVALDANNQLILNPRFRGFWDIRDASEYNTIQDAIDSLTKGIVLLRANTTYNLQSSQAITMKSGVYIVGEGWSSVIQKDAGWTGASGVPEMIKFPDGITDSGIMNCKIEGQNTANGAVNGVIAARCYGGDSLFFDKIWFHDWSNPADGIVAANDALYFGFTSVVDHAWISRCFFEDIQRNGIAVIHGTDIKIMHNSFDDIRNSAIDAEPNSTAHSIRSLFVSKNNIANLPLVAIGISIDGHNTRSAAGVPTNRASENKVIDNTLVNIGGNGIILYGLERSEASHNNLSQIAVNGDAHGILIRDSVKTHAKHNEINLVGTATSDDSDGIQIGGNNGAGEICEHCDAIDNTCDNIARHGVVLARGGGTRTEYCSAENNRTGSVNLHDSSNVGSGIAIDLATYVSIVGNKLEDTAGAPQMWQAIYIPGAPGVVSHAVVIGNRSIGHQAATAFTPGQVTNLADGDQVGVRESNQFV
jgi:hypothetical protein